ncbi:LytTR family transcriptional regulator [Aureibaculum marinum]|uniref:LytTR family transcriptional regulator n=1 Tax=Aureibaculum marinum TaxID=2487930 RepID=A0A3N4NWM9_9FLAO|nr:LytTR family DNA-binding domain-containing protein [Aureibaculum marinum]RPD96590.1 LytTR family transcriptional regulator [Aureibaculum marinum]
MVKINFSEILYVESLSDYIQTHLTNKTITSRETVSNIEAKLPQHQFLRVHHSFIISINKIEFFPMSL